MAARSSAAYAALLFAAACGDSGGGGIDAVSVIDVESTAETCTGGGDEDGDTFVDCEDDDCWDDASCYKIDDDSDLLAPDGDPSLDIDKFYVTLAAGVATFYATFDGDWPPSATIYSYYLMFEIDNDGNTPVASVTVLREAGVDSQPLVGISAADVTVRQTPRGVWARMRNVSSVGEKYYVESRIQKMMGVLPKSDTVVGAPAPLP